MNDSSFFRFLKLFVLPLAFGFSTMQATEELPKKNILILSSNGGYGHDAAAQTLKKLLDNRYNFEVIYPIDELRIWGIKSGEGIYNLMLQNGWIQAMNAITNHVAPKLFRLQKSNIEEVIQKHIQKSRPDLVISLIPFINRPAIEAARKCDVPYLLITTDNDLKHWVHGLHRIQHPNFKVTVGSDLASSRELLRKRNIPDQAIKTIGLPIRSDFFLAKDVESLKKEFGIARHKPVVLLMIGGAGGGQTLEYAKRIASTQFGLHLIVCAGKNQLLADKLRKIRLHPTNTMTVMEFTSRISDLMAMSDVVITKPGPGTIIEAMTMHVPILIDTISPLLSWEKVNISLMTQYGVGRSIGRFKELEHILRQYLFDTELQKEIQDAYWKVPVSPFHTAIEPLIESMWSHQQTQKELPHFASSSLTVAQ